MATVRIRTFYPADPLGIVPGGIDTFIRGLIKWAPEDFEFSLVGMSTEPEARPVGRWTRCSLGRRDFDFFPVVAVRDARGRSRIPLSLRYTLRLAARRKLLLQGFDVMELHRIEPLLVLAGSGRPTNAFFHQDMSVIGSNKSDILWRHFPQAYFWMENRLIPRLASAYCVHENGVRLMRSRFPALAQSIRFVPTWVDTELFHPAPRPNCLATSRSNLRKSCGFDAATRIVVTVGRLDSQKNPQLLLDAFGRIAAAHPDLCLTYVGDGVLRPRLEQAVHASGLAHRVRFLGLLNQDEIAETLRGADLFALSSAYEGMPMALLEAMGCGLPAVCTDVGGVRKVLVNGVNGFVVAGQGAEEFSAALEKALGNLANLRGDSCLRSIQQYRPWIVLSQVYANYRSLSAMMPAGR